MSSRRLLTLCTLLEKIDDGVHAAMASARRSETPAVSAPRQAAMMPSAGSLESLRPMTMTVPNAFQTKLTSRKRAAATPAT